MTIIEAINRVDEMKPNAYSQSQKVTWLSELDGLVKRKIIDSHKGGNEVVFEPYTDDTSLETILMIYEPYADAYVHWLESKIDYNNREFATYNNSITKFNEVFGDYTRDYNRTHMPNQNKIRFY